MPNFGMQIDAQCANHFHHRLLTRLRPRRECLVTTFAPQTRIFCQLCHPTRTSNSLDRRKKCVGISVVQRRRQTGGYRFLVIQGVSHIKRGEISHGQSFGNDVDSLLVRRADCPACSGMTVRLRLASLLLTRFDTAQEENWGRPKKQMTENLDCYGRRGKVGKNQMTLTPLIRHGASAPCVTIRPCGLINHRL